MDPISHIPPEIDHIDTKFIFFKEISRLSFKAIRFFGDFNSSTIKVAGRNATFFEDDTLKQSTWINNGKKKVWAFESVYIEEIRFLSQLCGDYISYHHTMT